mmetsp:Transcript_19089/g.35680  ORF Transcript_19089/g.35680 Transcript_19089/m.35680 type:complete len:83 (-) Transcript_19089:57-305(-)
MIHSCLVSDLLSSIVKALVALNEDEGYQIQNDPNIVPSTAMTLVEGYNYKSHPHLPYPTCRLQDGFGGHEFELVSADLMCIH